MAPICPACGSATWQSFLRLKTQLSLTSDQRIIDRPINKVICAGCGLVRNREMLGQQREVEYAHDYVLNSAGTEEHIYFTDHGPVPRSQAVFDWIEPYLPSEAQTVTEIGCGMGNLLRRLAKRFRKSAIVGVESNHRAAELARSHGFDVRCQFVGRETPPLPLSDLVIAYGVAEHVEAIAEFLSSIRGACRSGATVILCVPVQDHRGYDLFFSDHVWHFTLAQFVATLRWAGFDIIATDSNSATVKGFGLVAARVGGGAPMPMANESRIQTINRDTWTNQFRSVNRRIATVSGKVAVYGASEVLSLLLAYTHLGRLTISACLDDDANKIGTIKHGIPVHHPSDLECLTVNALLLTTHPRYYATIMARLGDVQPPIPILDELLEP